MGGFYTSGFKKNHRMLEQQEILDDIKFNSFKKYLWIALGLQLS